MSTVQIKLLGKVAIEAFGHYLHAPQPKTAYDFSDYESSGAFVDEISGGLTRMPRESQITAWMALKRGLREQFRHADLLVVSPGYAAFIAEQREASGDLSEEERFAEWLLSGANIEDLAAWRDGEFQAWWQRWKED